MRSILQEQHEKADRDRRALRVGDSLPDCLCGCTHNRWNHGPQGCCIPGCECKWPKDRTGEKP